MAAVQAPHLSVALHQSLTPELLTQVARWLPMPELAAVLACAPSWQSLLQGCEDLWRWHFFRRWPEGIEGCKDLHWYRRCHEARVLEQERNELFTSAPSGAMRTSVLLFSSYVRSLEHLELGEEQSRVAVGMYNGKVEIVDIPSGQRHPCQQAHRDEVVALDIGKFWIVSGSGDPGYYHRPGQDHVVRAWGPEGQLLQKLSGHSDSVRAVRLLRSGREASSSTSEAQVLTGSVDGTVRLWDLKRGALLATLSLESPVLAIIRRPERLEASSCASVASTSDEDCHEMALSEQFLVATSVALFELESAPLSTRQLYPSSSSSLSASPEQHGHFCSLSACWSPSKGSHGPRLQLAAGTTGGEIVTLVEGEEVRVTNLAGRRGRGIDEVSVISVQWLTPHRLVALCRAGVLGLFSFQASEAAACQWIMQGLRMYASTVRRFGSKGFVSDGFDNAIKIFDVSGAAGPLPVSSPLPGLQDDSEEEEEPESDEEDRPDDDAED